MTAPPEPPYTRLETAIAVGLALFGLGLFVASLMYVQGVWFRPVHALALGRVAWVLLWTPGVTICVVLLRRRFRLSLLLSLLGQLAAVPVYLMWADRLPVGAALGLSGLVLPTLVQVGRGDGSWGRRLRHAAFLVLLLAGACALIAWAGDNGASQAFYLAIAVSVALYPLAAAVWPELPYQIRAQEHREREWWESHLWASRLRLAAGFAVVAALFAFAAYLSWFCTHRP